MSASTRRAASSGDTESHTQNPSASTLLEVSFVGAPPPVAITMGSRPASRPSAAASSSRNAPSPSLAKISGIARPAA
ncbi:MAG TPA: hypothetical protein PJ994_13460, partial [Tepidiformaceae bacterium]|nr:hypothetical protein [Tepidiformaceae bacterium]